MARKYPTDYTGARGSLRIEDVPRLGDAYLLMPKLDGIYAHAHLDDRGRVHRLTTRTGADVAPALAQGVLGTLAGSPGSVLAGELMVGTQRAERDLEQAGYRRMHIFDLVHAPDHDVPMLGFQARRELLYRSRFEAQDGAEVVAGPDGYRDATSGRYTSARPVDESMPLVPVLSVSRAGELWDQAQAGDLEGFVVVAKQARIRDRGSKRKVKPVHTVDALVVSVLRGAALCVYGGAQFRVPTGKHGVRVGHVVEVGHEGWESYGPRFPRLVRVRHDLAATA